jgi:ABC-type multidrug transport system ATPase subunit
MNILSGLCPATSGDAILYTHSVSEEISQIRADLGVCPQYDILFDDLTAWEHITLYAGLKGVPKTKWKELAEALLKAVHLEGVADKPTAVFSGG